MIYAYKYPRSGKTLCALYGRENYAGFMAILGKGERLKFESDKDAYSKEIQHIYDETPTCYDGQWLVFEFMIPRYLMISSGCCLLKGNQAENRAVR